MTIKQLTYLLEISKCGSLNKAAQSLYVTQPNITKAIKELENELNTTLFYRNTKSKSITFTPEGIELLWYAKSLTEQFNIIENRFIKKLNSNYQKFSVSTQHYSFVAAAFINFLQNKIGNNFEFILREEKTHEVIEDVRTQKSSLGILFISEEAQPFTKNYLDAKNIEFFSLKKFNPHVFVRKSHPLTKYKNVTMEDLKDYPAVFFEQEVNAVNFYEELLNLKSYTQIIKVTDRGTIYNIIQHTDAYNIGTGNIVKEIGNNSIVTIPISENIPKIDVGWIKLKNVSLDENMKFFINVCKDYLKSE